MVTITRLDHLSMAAPDWREQAALLSRVLGFGLAYDFPPGPDGAFDGCTLAVPGGGTAFEVIAPARPDSFVQRFLDAGGPGLHHITVEVASIDEAVRSLQASGVTPFGGVQDDGEWYVTYVHPRESGGVLWQIYQPYRASPGKATVMLPDGLAGIRRVDGFALAVRDLELQTARQAGILGMPEEARWLDAALGARVAALRFPGTHVRLLVMEPVGAGPIADFLETGRPGLHHLDCTVLSLGDSVAALRGAGIAVEAGPSDAWLPPAATGGVRVRLREGPAAGQV
jgi:methylmalonyl-CoA/ethylmalonyl-CoA epimerase